MKYFFSFLQQLSALGVILPYTPLLSPKNTFCDFQLVQEENIHGQAHERRAYCLVLKVIKYPYGQRRERIMSTALIVNIRTNFKR